MDRAAEQLDQYRFRAASMDELGAGMAELAGQVTALARLGRAIAYGPVGRTAALAYGVRHAVGLRRVAGARLPGRVVERGELARAGPADAMIRRGFWLTAGAVAGIAGYRRVSAVGRARVRQP